MNEWTTTADILAYFTTHIVSNKMGSRFKTIYFSP